MKFLSRRSFMGTAGISTAGAGLAALSALTPRQAAAQRVYTKADWKMAEFEALTHHPAQAKQIFDTHTLAEGRFLQVIKNSLNGLEFGFGVPKDQIKIVAALHGPPNLLNFDDSIWQKYNLGDFLKVKDPATGAPALRNIYYPRSNAKSTDLQSPDSTLNDTSIQALQERGVVLLSCHNATEGLVREMLSQRGSKDPAEEVVKDFQSHLLPNVIVVPAMVAAIHILQAEGHFSYLSA